MYNSYIYTRLQLHIFLCPLVPCWILPLGKPKEFSIQTAKILTSILLCSVIVLPKYTSAASFCAVTPDGKIRVDDCKYGSYDECKHAIGSSGDCVSNQEEEIAPAKVAPYCIVTWSTECKYYDYETCNQAAKIQMGFCYLNPDYKDPNK